MFACSDSQLTFISISASLALIIMADNVDAIVHKTPPRNSALSAHSEAGLKSTSLAVGSAVVSEHISTVGVEVSIVRPWIARDVQNSEKCEADMMLQELLARCTGSFQYLSVSEKSKLLDFVRDLPRWSVLLLIMQRMGYEQWGLNCVFEPEPGFSGKVMVEDTQIDLELDIKSKERVTPFGIRGRATTVFSVKSEALSGLQRDPRFPNESSELVAELYWPEETRQSEPDILKEVYKIAQTYPDVRGDVPELVWFHITETSTSKIRVALGPKDAEQAEQGSRVLYIIVFRKLIPITTLSGDEFLAAWWQVVKCHRAIWKGGVLHRDVSPSNLMVYRLRGQFIGVLNDYDLSSFKRDGPRGLERTGTLPFIAKDLLTPDAMAGKVEHLYAHDAESLIWVLTWVCLRYEGGHLLSKKRPLEDWLISDARTCARAKAEFWSGGIRDVRPSGSHEVSWNLVRKCFQGIYSLYPPEESRKLADQAAFELLLGGPMLEHINHRRTSRGSVPPLEIALSNRQSQARNGLGYYYDFVMNRMVQ
ncbi:hypothetical protein C8R48DRAFT_833420 [Suillus tomentosus]|nr:hypothetical protein C8R48DRAFT_833420 [Suillus tomentosus]